MVSRYKIYKLQRPIATNEEFPQVMAYTEGKKHMAMIPMGEELMDELFGKELKVYAKARVKNGMLVVKQVVEEQSW